MKLLLSVVAIAITWGLSQAFTIGPSTSAAATTLASSTSLSAHMDRRAMLTNAATTAAVVVLPMPVFAKEKEYVPKADDVKQIYFLGASLDKLADKLASPDQIDSALDAVRLFNKDPNFYPGYAKNYIMKSVKKGSDADPRVGYIKQVSTLVVPYSILPTVGFLIQDK